MERRAGCYDSARRRLAGVWRELWMTLDPRHAASPCICHSAGLGKPSSVAPWPGCEPFHSRPDGARPPVAQRPRQPNVPANSRQSGPRAPLAVSSPRHLAHHNHCRPPSAPPQTPADCRQPLIYPNSSPYHRVCNFLTPPSSVLTQSIPVHRVDSGLATLYVGTALRMGQFVGQTRGARR